MKLDICGAPEKPAVLILHPTEIMSAYIKDIQNRLGDSYQYIAASFDIDEFRGGEREADILKLLIEDRKLSGFQFSIAWSVAGLTVLRLIDKGVEVGECFFEGVPLFDAPWITKKKIAAEIKMGKKYYEKRPDAVRKKLAEKDYFSNSLDFEGLLKSMSGYDINNIINYALSFKWIEISREQQRKIHIRYGTEGVEKYNRAQGARIKEKYPDVEIKVYKGCGHCNGFERNPEKYIEWLKVKGKSK